mmetsp:Transcript_50376/g.117530  ORF Transcript_50376/g.117530 Transcript_50376/m.117530 type:complete len:424 (+) Transcript_50376:71-1342(+)
MGCSSSQPEEEQIPETAEFFKRFALGKKLGEGAFGQVRVANEIATKKEFAVKIADVRVQDPQSGLSVSKRRRKNLEREIRMWRLASADKVPEITCLECVFFCGGFYYMVCEICKRNLMQHLLHAKTLSEEEFATLAAQMLRGISHVHDVGLVHRDVKPENFLCGGKDHLELKLCDFGLALQQPKKGKLMGIGGTAPYMAPETLIIQDGWWSKPLFHKEVDLWAFGVILYLILFGRFPYMPPGEATAESMKHSIKNNFPPLNFPDSPSSRALTLAKRVLVRDPKARATAKDALLDPFVAQATPRQEAKGKNLRVSVQDAKEIAEKLREFQISENTQQDLESRLKIVTAKSGGIWFSEGDDKALSPTASTNSISFRADSRIKKDKKPVSRDKFGTHSGVVSEEKVPNAVQKSASIPEETSPHHLA